MPKLYSITEDFVERGGEGMDSMLEKAFKEGCEHGYRKAMREIDGYNERASRTNYRESFEEKMEKLKRKYS